MSLASNLLAISKRNIRSFGQPLTVTRRPATHGGSATTQSVYFLVQPLNVTEVSSLQIEGDINAANSNPFRFVCAGDEDVLEGLDSVTFRGGTYQLTNISEKMCAGTPYEFHCVGVRVNGS